MRQAEIQKWMLNCHSELITDDTEQELPSSSHFYFLSNRDEDDVFKSPLPCQSEELQNTSFPLRYTNATADIDHTSFIQKQVNALTLTENGRFGKRTTDFDLDVALLADEYKRLKKLTETSENIVGNNDVKLDMQDKELEAIVASIAELCDLNVTRTRDVKHEERHINERFNHDIYGNRALSRDTENKEMSQEVKNFQGEIDNKIKTRQATEQDNDAELKLQLENLKTEIKSEEKRSKLIQQELLTTRNYYKYLRRYTISEDDDVEPCSTLNDMPSVGTLSRTTQPVLNSYTTLSPLSRSVSATPRPGNLPQHMDLSASTSTWSSCLTPCKRNVRTNLNNDDSNNNFIDV